MTAADPTQAGRVVRGGIPSTCLGKSNTLQNTTPVVRDAYNYVAPVTGCATVEFNALQCGGATTQAVAYSTYNPAAPATGVIGDFGFSTTGTASFSFPVTAGQGFTVVVHDILETTNVLCGNYSFTLSYRTGCRLPGFDRTNDGKADPVVWTPTTGIWSILNSAGGTESKLFGLAGDIPTPGDYTGDGQTDVSTYRPSTNTWFYSTSQTSPQTNVTYVPWGVAGDQVVPGDYDKDGKADVAIWRPSNGTWYILRSSNQTVQYVHWGQNGDIPAPADYDGDLITDFAVVRPNQAGVTPNYQWYILQSNFDFGFALTARWGVAGDKVVPADYNGDGKADMALFRPSDGRWYVIPSSRSDALSTARFGFDWGIAEDIPQPADYDGDFRTDYAVFRPSTGTWYISNSMGGTYGTYSAPVWGAPGDIPATAPYPIRP